MLRAFKRRPIAAAVAFAALTVGGCATYTDNLRHASNAAAGGNYNDAVTSLNEALKVSSNAEVPGRLGADGALLVLERGVLLQSLESFQDSSKNLSAAEEAIEVLDFTTDPIGTLGGYIYSDSAKPYQSPPSERLALNAVNLLNYLALGDLEGAAVEARRFQVMRDFLESRSIDDRGVGAFGAYLAGYVFERRGEGGRALRYYDEALAAGDLRSLQRPAAKLARQNSYRGERLAAFLKQGGGGGDKNDGEVTVILSVGRVPFKVPERIPVGAAIGIAGTAATGNYDWLARGGGKVVVYPELVEARTTLGPPQVQIDGRDIAVEPLIDIGAAVRREYADMKPRIIAAALTRMAARAGVAEGVRAAGRQESDALGAILGLAVESAMVAMDRPDTRSWTMLPGRVLVARVPVSPGAHTVDVSFGSSLGRRSFSIDVAAAGQTAIVVTEPR